jgi:hypothetical protein
VEQALQAIVTVKDQFIVNDSLWFRIQKGKATPAVVNSAHFMTSHFTQFLVQNPGWESPKEISGQEIDGYLELQTDQGTCLDRDSLLHIIGRIWRQGSNEPDVVFSSLYQKVPSFLILLTFRSVRILCTLCNGKVFFVR